MIKKIIFDIDNTIIPFSENVDELFEEVLKKHGYNIKGIVLYDAIGDYEKSLKYEYFNLDELITFVKKELNIDFTDEFIEDFFKMYNGLVEEPTPEEIETLDYLSKKYELVAYSNWFTDSQEKRMEKLDILKYFKKIYGADIVKMKPLKEGYKEVVGNYKYEECLMVGDNIDMDIIPPSELGINVIYLTNKENDKFKTIKSISQLKEML